MANISTLWMRELCEREILQSGAEERVSCEDEKCGDMYTSKSPTRQYCKRSVIPVLTTPLVSTHRHLLAANLTQP